jgi:hypothetical protein
MHTSIGRGISAAFVILAASLILAAPRAPAQSPAQSPAPSPAPRRPAPARVQSAGTSGTISGLVADPTGAVIANATVTLANAISGLSRTAATDNSGAYTISNIPFNTYRLTVTASTMAPATQTVDVQSFVPIALTTTLQIASASTVVDVTTTSSDLVEADPVGHTDVDRDLFAKIPLESISSSVSSLVTLSSPGVSADSNGMFHGMGDHASNSFSVDGQSITDQTSKTFSNQIPMDSVQSLEVIPGAPPAEFGGKTSLVIVATTRSGLGESKPTGDLTVSYGSFGSSNVGLNLATGSQKFGNFVSLNVMDTGRFLDPPEFHAIHDHGNEESLFDRIDYQISNANSARLNLGYTRSWFQTPNSYDSQYATQWPTNSSGVAIGPNNFPVGPSDQRSQIQTINLAPSYTHVISPTTVLNAGYFFRRDGFNYYPSNNPFADRGAPDLQQETIAQQRSLANTGLHSDLTITHGGNNIKAGASYTQTFLTENFQLGIVDPTYAITPTLAPYNLVTGGSLYPFHGHTDIKEFAAYAQDAITFGPWTGNLGLRFDQYNGLTVANQVEPRLALSYHIKRTGTVLRTSYARSLESPFNENLILASQGCNSAVIAALIPCTPAPNRPGFRNDFHAGFQQQLSRFAVLSADYVWEYTHNAYDFSVLGATPITFPIGWNNSKIPGFDGRLDVPSIHNFTAQVVFSSVAARFFTPQTSGLGTTVQSGQAGVHTPFRIDHDEKFNQTTHAQYQLGKRGPYIGFNWRYDSGQVAGAAPCYGSLASNDCPQTTTLLVNGVAQPAVYLEDANKIALTADQEAQAGFACNGVSAALGHPLPATCLVSQFTSSLLKLPAPNAENDDHNPPRIAPRNLFDLSFGEDNLLRRKPENKRTLSASVTIVNLTNKVALYNFLSTFSGTHFVSPRSLTAQLAYHF